MSATQSAESTGKDRTGSVPQTSSGLASNWYLSAVISCCPFSTRLCHQWHSLKCGGARKTPILLHRKPTKSHYSEHIHHERRPTTRYHQFPQIDPRHPESCRGLILDRWSHRWMGMGCRSTTWRHKMWKDPIGLCFLICPTSRILLFLVEWEKLQYFLIDKFHAFIYSWNGS